MRLDHPNIAKIIELWQWDKLLFIVMDFYEGGELTALLENKGFFEEFEAFKIVKQITSILIYLEDKKVAHRDLCL
jgi:serine/threonine protein kinase